MMMMMMLNTTLDRVEESESDKAPSPFQLYYGQLHCGRGTSSRRVRVDGKCSWRQEQRMTERQRKENHE